MHVQPAGMKVFCESCQKAQMGCLEWTKKLKNHNFWIIHNNQFFSDFTSADVTSSRYTL